MTKSPENLLSGLSKIPNANRIPPVEKWNPPYCGELDIHISRNGLWNYLGTPIGRPALVRLFSSILWREGEEYFLVTPVEKVKIRVDDVPLFAIDFSLEDDGLHFMTSTDDHVLASKDNPIVLRFDESGEPSPYILIRRNLWALIDRKSFYRLIDLGEIIGEDFGVQSGGEFFPFMKASALE